MVPRVSYGTAILAVRYVPVPVAGTVFAGTGAVCEMPTRGIPVPNANENQQERGSASTNK